MEPEPFLRQADDGGWIAHHHPYRDLPELECHIAPPYVVINAGPKCIGLDLNKIALDYHQSETSDSHRELKLQLELLRDTWALFENAKEAAKAWEEKERDGRKKQKRKRDEDDIDTSSMTTKRTTRSQSRSAKGGYENRPGPSRPGSQASKDRSEGSYANTQPKRRSTIRKRKRGNSSNEATLTEAAVLHLSKRKRMPDSNTAVKRWVKSTYG
jgi:hypothetical protein